MSLEDVLGQNKIIQSLRHALLEDNLFHAYIFEGAEGIGKKFTAFNFAKAILCDNGDLSCKDCWVCNKMDTGNHPDYHFIEPNGNSIKDAQIESVQEIMSIKPYEGKNTVIVLNNADKMTIRAQNRFLKSLEEPRGNSVVILLTTNADSFLPTIVSRCMVMKFKPLNKNVMCDYLAETFNVSMAYANVLAAFAYGNIGRAVKLYKSESFKENREKSIKVALDLSHVDDENFYSIVHAFESVKDIAAEFFDMLQFWFRDIVLLSVKSHHDLVMNGDHLGDLIKESKKIGFKKAAKMIDIIEETKKDLKMHLNYSLVIKNMLFKIQEV